MENHCLNVSQSPTSNLNCLVYYSQNRSRQSLKALKHVENRLDRQGIVFSVWNVRSNNSKCTLELSIIRIVGDVEEIVFYDLQGGVQSVEVGCSLCVLLYLSFVSPEARETMSMK